MELWLLRESRDEAIKRNEGNSVNVVNVVHMVDGFREDVVQVHQLALN